MRFIGLKFLCAVACFLAGANFSLSAGSNTIDRRAVVERHNPSFSQIRKESPSQVGNGEFAFSFDITGLQTFIPFNTLAHWAWHSEPLPDGVKESDFKGLKIKAFGKTRVYPSDLASAKKAVEKYPEAFPDAEFSEREKLAAKWLKENPHALNLGRIGFVFVSDSGKTAELSDISNARQTLRLFDGYAESVFDVFGQTVKTRTFAHPSRDALCVNVDSPLIKSGRLKIFVEFPYGDSRDRAFFVGDWNSPGKHKSLLEENKFSAEGGTALVRRILDCDSYFARISWSGKASFEADKDNSHRFYIVPSGDKLDFICEFSKLPPAADLETGSAFAENVRMWNSYWQSGAALDFGGTEDPRAFELERRIILSLYLMRVQECGSLPPQESGLLSNSWHGKFHYEMIFWHAAHFGAWGRRHLADRQLGVYFKALEGAKKRAAEQGYSGARWFKCSGDTLAEWPHIIHATLIWQQPHPIWFARQAYMLNPSREVLEKYSEIVFQTADFMASFARKDESGRYNLDYPITVVSENCDLLSTRNPAFELGYWRYGLRAALEWRSLMGLPENPKWREVLDNLAPIPVEEGVYVTYEGIPDMWTKMNFEHPALSGIYGVLPGDGVDREVFARTLGKILQEWNFDRVWGWDFPMLAMACSRLGWRDKSIDMLLHPSKNFMFDEHGIATGGPCPYFPSNGGLLLAVAYMAANGDSPNGLFPESWRVKREGFPKFE